MNYPFVLHIQSQNYQCGKTYGFHMCTGNTTLCIGPKLICIYIMYVYLYVQLFYVPMLMA